MEIVNQRDMHEEDDKCSSAMNLTEMPGDILIHLFSILSYQDRARLSSVCRSLRSVSHSPSLWTSIDLRSHKFDISTANSLSSRCGFLKKIRIQGHESADAMINLKARNLIEISCNLCQKLSNVNLSLIAAKHSLLESIYLGPELCNWIYGDGIKALRYCPNLKKLWISEIYGVDSALFIPLVNNCRGLVNVAFIDCANFDLTAIDELASFASVRYLSIAGVELKSDSIIEHWIKFPNLVALDISRSNIISTDITKLLSCCPKLKVLCALHCPALDEDIKFYHNIRNIVGLKLISKLADIPAVLSSLAVNHTIMLWIEQVLSHSFLRLVERNIPSMEDFWVNQGATLLINWLESSQEDVREMAAKIIVKFVINIGDIGDDEKTKYEKRANAVIHGGGIRSLLNLAKSSNDGDQIGVRLEVAKTITILCLDNTISNVIVEEGGIQLLLNWVNSTNKTLFEETIKALKNLSLRDAHNKIIIFECGGLEVLMNLVYRWTSSSKKVLKHVLVTLENMASDDKISMEIIKNGGLNALVTLTQECMSMGVLNQIIRVFANLAGIGYTNNNNITFELEPSLLQRLEQLIRSPLHGLRQEAVIALWNWSSNTEIREIIVALDDFEALKTLPVYNGDL